MFLIVGLGNPGDRYQNTRHNVGFEAIDMLANKYNISVNTKEKKALIGKGLIDGKKVCLVKPQTFMNLSGESVGALAQYYGINTVDEVIIIYDDISLEPGQMRIRIKGSAGGHNGIKSLIQHFGSQEFIRIKVGVGQKPKEYDLADYVLGHFSQGEQKIMKDGYDRVATAVEHILLEEIEKAMNQFNKKLPIGE